MAPLARSTAAFSADSDALDGAWSGGSRKLHPFATRSPTNAVSAASEADAPLSSWGQVSTVAPMLRRTAAVSMPPGDGGGHGGSKSILSSLHSVERSGWTRWQLVGHSEEPAAAGSGASAGSSTSGRGEVRSVRWLARSTQRGWTTGVRAARAVTNLGVSEIRGITRWVTCGAAWPAD